MEQLQKSIEEWKHLTHLQETSGDMTRCPKCKDQVAFCDCPVQLAQQILTEITDKNMLITQRKPFKMTVRIKDSKS